MDDFILICHKCDRDIEITTAGIINHDGLDLLYGVTEYGDNIQVKCKCGNEVVILNR